MCCLSSRENKMSKSGHPKMQNPIMLWLNAKSIQIAPPGNSYVLCNDLSYIKLSDEKNGEKTMKKVTNFSRSKGDEFFRDFHGK